MFASHNQLLSFPSPLSHVEQSPHPLYLLRDIGRNQMSGTIPKELGLLGNLTNMFDRLLIPLFSYRSVFLLAGPNSTTS